MQLYALDQDQKVVFAKYAAKQKNYFCFECKGFVRRRGGTHRHVHFYHLAATHSCRLNGKSMAHLQIQSYLKHILPYGECHLECRFPEINRIADAVWEEQKIIFEVQCSAISLEEVKKRNQDYSSIGYQVVWILHDSKYNQQRVTPAEQWLVNSPHYFSNMDAEGRGIIYDQFSAVNKGVRSNVLEPLSVNLENPIRIKQSTSHAIPILVLERMECWPIFFKGDLLDTCLQDSSCEYMTRSLEVETLLASLKAKPKTWWKKLLRLYWIFFQIILERACK